MEIQEILENYEKLKNWHDCSFKNDVLKHGNINNIINDKKMISYYYIKSRQVKEYIISIPKTGSTSLWKELLLKYKNYFSVCKSHCDLLSEFSWYEKLDMPVPSEYNIDQYYCDIMLIETLVMIQIYLNVKIYITYRKPICQAISYYFFFRRKYSLPIFTADIKLIQYIIDLSLKRWQRLHNLLIFLFNTDNLKDIIKNYNVEIFYIYNNKNIHNSNNSNEYFAFKKMVYKKFNIDKLNLYLLQKNKFAKLYYDQFEEIINGSIKN